MPDGADADGVYGIRDVIVDDGGADRWLLVGLAWSIMLPQLRRQHCAMTNSLRASQA